MLAECWPKESDWSAVLADVLASKAFRQLSQFIDTERAAHTIFPAADDVFNAFRWTPFNQVKVVILGQDPYHGAGQAHGLAFSVAGNCRQPPSLKNIFRELQTDLQIQLPVGGGSLESWAKQGVLLLNTVLTVREGQPQSHAKQGWEEFTDAVIRTLGQQATRRIVFVLWGKQAEKKRALIGSSHTTIISAHPSPLSASRGFFGSRPFSHINRALENSGQSPIDWGDQETIPS